MKKRNYSVLSLLCGIVLLVACGDPIPIKEMALARYDISQALSVKADKYAPEQLKEAHELLLSAHKSSADDKLDEAKKQALASQEKAKEAYEIAVPLLAKDTIDIAEKSLQEADEAYATEFAATDYAEASEQLQNAQSLFESKKFYDAYLAAIDADAAAKNARNTALGKKDLLKDAIDEVKLTIDNAKKYGAEEVVPEKIKLAEEHVDKAETSYNDLKLKKGFEEIEVAKLNADESYITALKQAASANIDEAAIAIGNAEASDGAKQAPDTLDGAKEMLLTAKTQFDSSQYLQAIDSADEAKRLAGEVIEAGKVASVKKPETKEDVSTGQMTEEDKDFYIYKVKYFKTPPKDCLWIISRKYYKNPRLWKKIYKANKDKIKNPNLIYPGWELKIPKLEK